MCGAVKGKQCMSRVVEMFFFFQADDGIRDAQESRGLGDVYKRQTLHSLPIFTALSCPLLI